MEESIIIKQNTKGNIIYACMALIMSVCSLVLVFADVRMETTILAPITQNQIGYILLKVIFVFGTLFFGYAFFYILKKGKEGKDILIVDDRGITDHSSAVAVGFIPWADINRIYMDSVMGNKFIEIEINNEEQYLSKLSGIKKAAVFSNKKMGHQIVCITLNTTGISPESVLPKIQERFEKVKAQ